MNNLPRVVTQPRLGCGSNSRPLDRKSDALHCATTPRTFLPQCEYFVADDTVDIKRWTIVLRHLARRTLPGLLSVTPMVDR